MYPRQGLQSVKQRPGQGAAVLENSACSGFYNKLDTCAESGDAGPVVRSAFIAVRKKAGLQVRLGIAARSAEPERDRFDAFFYVKSARALGAEKTHVARKREEVDVHRCGIYGYNPGGLGNEVAALSR